MHIGQIIKEVIDEKNLSYKQVANDIGITPQNFNGLLKRESCDITLILKLEKALDYDLLRRIRKESPL